MRAIRSRRPRRIEPSAAHPIKTHIEMQMALMRCVVVGAENGMEIAAGADAHVVQELRLVVRAMPVFLYGHASAVTQHETRDIDGVGCGMLAQALMPMPADDVAAGKAAEVIDGDLSLIHI